MAKFIMMCGLQGSGKSTLAKKLAKKYNGIVLSSDQIRKNLYGDENIQKDHHKVFEIMDNRAKQLLSEGINVIYDSTNTNMKRRKHLINHEIRNADEYKIYYMNKQVEGIKYHNRNRDRVVPETVIDKTYKRLQIPIKSEGWDEVHFYNTDEHNLALLKEMELPREHDSLFKMLSSFMPDFESIYNLPQDSSYHSFSVSRHTFHVYDYILNNYDKDDKLIMIWASLFHDLGKAFCKSFINHRGEITRYSSFIGHENVSAQLAAYYLTMIGYDDQFIKDVVALVQFHMIPMNAGEKKMKQVKELLGDDLFDKLMILHKADTKAK